MSGWHIQTRSRATQPWCYYSGGRTPDLAHAAQKVSDLTAGERHYAFPYQYRIGFYDDIAQAAYDARHPENVVEGDTP